MKHKTHKIRKNTRHGQSQAGRVQDEADIEQAENWDKAFATFERRDSRPKWPNQNLGSVFGEG